MDVALQLCAFKHREELGSKLKAVCLNDVVKNYLYLNIQFFCTLHLTSSVPNLQRQCWVFRLENLNALIDIVMAVLKNVFSVFGCLVFHCFPCFQVNNSDILKLKDILVCRTTPKLFRFRLCCHKPYSGVQYLEHCSNDHQRYLVCLRKPFPKDCKLETSFLIQFTTELLAHLSTGFFFLKLYDNMIAFLYSVCPYSSEDHPDWCPDDFSVLWYMFSLRYPKDQN